MISKTTTTFTTTKPRCHDGNTPIFELENGGTFYIGGWSNGAVFDWNTHVIDLTGSEHKFQDIPFAYDDSSLEFMPFLGRSYAGWLSLPFPDFGTPSKIRTLEQWTGIAETIKKLLEKGVDVLVACHGGHGRSGLFASIVGYILHDGQGEWASPVEALRDMHCNEAVETFAQEKFVYDILGLNIQITHSFDRDDIWHSGINRYLPCPLCGTQSMFVEDQGMCLGCKTKFENMGKAIPVRRDLTLEDIKGGGLVKHECDKGEKCIGVWKAETCGHIVHDMVVYDGWCTSCWDRHQDEIEYAEKQIAKETPQTTTLDGYEENGVCAICENPTIYAKRFGVCYECSDDIIKTGRADEVHNTITDPYKAVAHKCNDDVHCTGVVTADICKHVVHNREVEDGLCPSCLVNSKKYRNKQEES